MVFKDAEYQCKRIIKPLKARSLPLDDCIGDTINIKSHDMMILGYVMFDITGFPQV